MTEAAARQDKAVPEAAVPLPGREVPIEAAHHPAQGAPAAAPEEAAAPIPLPGLPATAVPEEAAPITGGILMDTGAL